MSEIVQLFQQYSNKKIALYGLGSETERVLREFGDSFDIAGLLDSFKESGEMIYGKPVIALPEAVEAGAELIIVVARPGSCKAITRKIGDICREHRIALFDIRGKDLLAENRVTYDLTGAEGITRAEFHKLCMQAEVISFDLFDTLVVRRIYEPTDMIALVHARLLETGIDIEDFCIKRLSAEKELSRTYAPQLVDIYRSVIEKSARDGWTEDITAEYLADFEWRTDFKTLVPRRDVAEVFRTLIQNKKRVYVVTDTYYSRKQISEILYRCGIDGYVDILASCEFMTGKTGDLFDALKAKEPGRKILHVGDDPAADIACARAKGLDTCRLYSGLDMMDYSGGLGMEKLASCLSDKIRLGMFAADLFNSPFQFETDKNRIGVTDSYDIGYLFCAPVFCDFLFWFDRKIKEYGISNIWFAARDGFLIQKMYTMFLNEQNRNDDSVYFLTSRTAATRAGVQNEDDIEYIDAMKYHGTLEENLKERFGIEAESIEDTEVLKEEEGLLRYKNAVLKHAESEKVNYQKYLEGLKIKAGTIAFFDFVAKGTTQKYIQRLIDHHLKGFYFLQLEPEYERCNGMDIESFYGAEEVNTSAVFENYYILETLLTAPHPSVSTFNEMGEPIYAEETRSDDDITCFIRAQDGILDYLDTYIRLCPAKERRENKKLDDVMLALIHGVEIRDRNLLNLVVEDPFFNRMTKITDLL